MSVGIGADGRARPRDEPVRVRLLGRRPRNVPGWLWWIGRPQHLHRGPAHPEAPEADAGPGPQQDARRPAVRRVPRVLPGQRRRVLRQLLRLLPARGVPAALGHVHREGLLAQRGDRPPPPRGDPRAVRAPRRDHRRVRVVHLRPRRPGRLRRHDPAPPNRWPVPPRRRAPPPRRPAIPAQRHGPDPRAVPGAWRHPGDRAGLVGGDRPGRVLRRRGRADHRDRPAHGRAARGAQGAQHLPGDPLRDAARQAPARDRDHRGRDGGARRPDGGGGSGPRGRAAPPADDVRPRDAARARLLQRRRELLAPPEPARARLAAVDAARLFPAGLAPDRRRVAHHDPAGRRHVQERPDAQGDPGRLRLPPPVGARQPAAHLRGVRGDREPGRVRVGHAGAVRARERASGSSSS